MIKLVNGMTPKKLLATKKVDLGSGRSPEAGHVHMDILPFCPHVEIIGDLRGALPFADGQLDVVRAAHVIEHIPGWCRMLVLREWRRVLKPGGLLRLATPSLFETMAAFKKGEIDEDRFFDILYAGQFNEYATHFYCFTPKRLHQELLKVGFEKVRITVKKRTACHVIFADAVK